MQNVMWAVNIAYDRDDRRGFVRRRITALWMVVFALIGFGLAFGVLVLGPHLSTWLGNAVGAQTLVKTAWYVAEWPLLIGGLLFVFAALMYYGPNVEHPRWRVLLFLGGGVLVRLLAAFGGVSVYSGPVYSCHNNTGARPAAVVV